MLLSEILGVERDTDFSVEGYYGKFRVRVNNGYEFFVVSDGKGVYDTVVTGAIVYDIIAVAPAGIILLPPPLTDEQREQLKAIWTLGYRWLVKDMTGDVFAFGFKPVKHSDWMAWMLSTADKNEMEIELNKDLNVCTLVSWSDPEPLDIGKALGVVT